MLSRSDLLFTLETINLCLKANSASNILSIFMTLKNQIDLQGILLCKQENHCIDQFSSAEIIDHGMNNEWSNIYVNNEYFKIDPVLSKAYQSDSPVIWSHIFNHHTSAKSFQNDASEFGLVEGMTIASKNGRNSGSASLVSVFSNQNQLSSRDEAILFQLLPHLNEALKACASTIHYKLTPKEVEVLSWAKEGKSYWETGKIMNISERTVKFHLQNIYQKLDVCNRAQAISKALRVGIIKME